MSQPLNDAALDQLFRTARTQNGWTGKPVPLDQVKAIYDLMKWGATSANCFPMRLVWVHSDAAKQRLAKHTLDSNQQRVLTAPVTVIIGWDEKFYDKIPELFPHAPEARDWFSSSPELAHTTAFRNCTLQGAYLMMAARALGLDTGPMSGFDNAGVDADFFKGTSFKSNFICCIGHGDEKALFGRSPRPDFDDVCQVL